MKRFFVHHRIQAAPRRWQAVAERLVLASLEDGALYGVWRSQIGRPRDGLQAMTVWPDDTSAGLAEARLLADIAEIRSVRSEWLVPTLRPADPAPTAREGNHAFRWFATPRPDWPEFLELCEAA